MKKILVTGASGFIGSFIVEEALAKNMEVWAAVRKSSSRGYLQDSRIRFLELDLSSPDLLKEQLSPHQFDYVVHAAGVTKCLHQEDFYQVNVDGTKHLIDALIATQPSLERFVFISSLSVYGAIHESLPYREIEEDDEKKPNTAYGKSKWLAEQYLEKAGEKQMADGKKFPYVILRPTGVYGPREKDYYMMAKSIKNHIDFSVGYQRQDITFVYVKDVVQAVFLALDHGRHGRAYFLSDGQVYQSATFSNLIHEELGHPWWIRIKAPIWILRIITFCGEHIAHMTGKISALNNDKYNILKQRNWRCNIQPARDELGFKPEYELERGVKETVKWYQDHKWL